jgi:hypothetical protein
MKFEELVKFALERGYTVRKEKNTITWIKTLDKTSGTAYSIKDAMKEIVADWHYDFEKVSR